MHTGQAIGRHLRAYLHRVLDRSVDFTWLSGLELHWQPHLMSLFSPTAQRRLRAIGLLDTAATLSPFDLLGKSITNVHDLTVLLGVLTPRPTRQYFSPPLELDLQSQVLLSDERLQYRPFPLEASEKWRPDPLTPVTFVFSPEISIHHTDGRFAWLIHLLATHAPATLVPPGAPFVHFPDIDDGFGSPALASVAHALRHAVHSAADMNVQEEINDIASRVSRATRNRSRTTTQICLRYGSDGTPRSLDDVAELFAISRQSVFTQINIARSLCSKSDFAPALRRLAQALDAHAGRPIDAVEHDLRPLLGPTQRLVPALQFAKDFFGIVPTTPLYSALPPGARTLRKYLGEAAAHTNRGVIAALRDRFRSDGLCYAADAIAAVPPGSNHASPSSALLDAVTHDPSIVWLGPDQRWLLFVNPVSPLVRGLVQIAHVAHPHPVSIASAADGLRVLLDRNPASVQPSIELLRDAVRLLAPTAGLSLQPDSLILPAAPDPLSHITAAQRRIYECLVLHGGYAVPDVIRGAISSLSNASAAMIDQRVSSCCFVSPAPPGYLLRGWPHPASAPDAIDPDQQPYRIAVPLVHCYLNNSAAQRVKQADRLVYLPSPLPDLIRGVFEHADHLWPDITVRNGRIHRLSSIATALGIPPGGRFHLEIDLERRQFRVHGNSRPTDAAP